MFSAMLQSVAQNQSLTMLWKRTMLSTRTVRKWSPMVQLSHTWDQVISGSRRVVNNTQDVNKMSDGHRNVVIYQLCRIRILYLITSTS